MTSLFACKHEALVPPIDLTTGNPPIVDTSITILPGVPCDPDTVYFVNDILPLFVSNCAQSGCHDVESHEDGVILTDYNHIIDTGDIEHYDPNDSEVYEVITENDPDDVMPPPPNVPLTASQIASIYAWIAQGALNNECSECDTSSVTFSAFIQPLIQLKCQGCHSGASPSGDLTLTTYDQIKAIALNGALENSIEGTGGYVLMPSNSGPLPDCEKAMILNWIDDGAPNN
jgi:hypothetical protein